MLVPELNAGQLSLEVERILGRERVSGIRRVNGEAITPADIATQAQALIPGSESGAGESAPAAGQTATNANQKRAAS